MNLDILSNEEIQKELNNLIKVKCYLKEEYENNKKQECLYNAQILILTKSVKSGENQIIQIRKEMEEIHQTLEKKNDISEKRQIKEIIMENLQSILDWEFLMDQHKMDIRISKELYDKHDYLADQFSKKLLEVEKEIEEKTIQILESEDEIKREKKAKKKIAEQLGFQKFDNLSEFQN